jgi:hypothetical protein
MATMLEVYTTEEQHSVVSFLRAKDIHKKMLPVYSGKCLSCRAVYSWFKIFCQGRWKVADNAQPGYPVDIATEATVQQAEELI